MRLTSPSSALGALVAAALLAAACGPAGSRNIVTDERDLAPFNRIEVTEGIDLDVAVDASSRQLVAVVYDDNLLDRIGTTVEDGTLVVEVLDSFRVTGGGRFVQVVVPDLEQIEVDSGADVRGRGTIGLIRIIASGGGAADLVELQARDVVVDASGGAFIAVFATDSVTGEAREGADVVIHGEPITVDVDEQSGADVDVAG
jgi:hypothetical protein